MSNVPPAISSKVRAGRRAKRRGYRGEAQVVDILRAFGWKKAHRNPERPQYGRDILDGPEGTWISVKLTERLKLREAYAEAKAFCGYCVPIVIHRCNNQEWLMTLPLDEGLELLALRERG